MPGSDRGAEDFPVDLVIGDGAVWPAVDEDGEDFISLGAPQILAGPRAQLAAVTHRITGPPGRRRTLILAGGVVALATAVALIVNGGPAVPKSPHPGPSAVALPTLPTPSASTAPHQLPSFADNPFGPADVGLPNLGTPLLLAGGAPLDVAITDTALYVLLDTELAVVNAYTRDIIAQVPVTTSANSHLVLDPGASVWVVDENAEPARVQQFSAGLLTPTRSLNASGNILAATALDGSLFVATSLGVDQMLPGASALTPVLTSTPPISALSVDRVHDTVIGLIRGESGGLVTISADGNVHEAGPQLSVVNGGVAAVGDTLWISGLGDGDGVGRFDPVTMQPLDPAAGGVAVEPAGGNGKFGLTISAGANDLWAYSVQTKQLFCLDIHTGQELEHWDGLAGPVTAGGSGPYSIAGGKVVPLVLQGNCRG